MELILVCLPTLVIVLACIGFQAILNWLNDRYYDKPPGYRLDKETQQAIELIQWTYGQQRITGNTLLGSLHMADIEHELDHQRNLNIKFFGIEEKKKHPLPPTDLSEYAADMNIAVQCLMLDLQEGNLGQETAIRQVELIQDRLNKIRAIAER